MLPQTDWPAIKDLAQRTISVFGSTFICEHSFSGMKQTKTGARARPTDENLHSLLRLQVGIGFHTEYYGLSSRIPSTSISLDYSIFNFTLNFISIFFLFQFFHSFLHYVFNFQIVIAGRIGHAGRRLPTHGLQRLAKLKGATYKGSTWSDNGPQHGST